MADDREVPGTVAGAADKVQVWMSRWLLWNTIGSAIVIAAGFVWLLVQTPVGGLIPTGSPVVGPLGMITSGLFLLILGPYVRVALGVALFATLGDRLYAGVSLAVLMVLLLGLALGTAH